MKSAQVKRTGKLKPRGRPFPKGKSGCPTGRPKGVLSLGTYLRQRFEANNNKELNQIIERCKKKKPEVLLHYAYGKPLESVELTGPGGGSVMEPLALAIAQHLAKQK